MAHNTDSDADEQSTDQSDQRVNVDGLPDAANAPPTTEDGDIDTDAIAVEEDFRHQRGPDGEILPVWEPLPGGEKHVLVTPITQGEANKWLPEDGNILDLGDSQLSKVLQEFYVQPSFDDLTVDDVAEVRESNSRAEVSTSNPLDDFGAFGLDPLLMALANASNFDVFRGMLADNAEMVSAVEEVEGNSTSGS